MSLNIGNQYLRSYLKKCFFLSFLRSYRKTAYADLQNLISKTSKDNVQSADIAKIPKIQRSMTPALLPSEIEKLKIIELNKSILQAESVNYLFNIYIDNRTTYDEYQFLYTTKRLVELMKLGITSTDDLLKNKIFESICYDIWKITSQLEATTVLSFYKNFLDMKVSSHYLIMQSLLQMMRHQINLLTLKDLIFLNPMLKKTEACHLKHGLQAAVPRVVENCLKLYFPPNLKFSELTQLLQICVEGDLKEASLVIKHVYRRALFKHLLNTDNPSLNLDLIALLFSLLKLLSKRNFPLSEDDEYVSTILMINCLNHLAKNELVNVDQKVVLTLMRNLAKCFNLGNKFYALNEDFLSKVSSKSVAEKWDLETLCTIIELQLDMNYVSDELLSHFSSLAKNATEMASLQSHIPTLISALAASSLPFEESRSLTRLLMSSLDLPTDEFEIPWLEFAINLLSLNYYSEDFFKTILDPKFLRSYLESLPDIPQDAIFLPRLDASLKVWHPDANVRVSTELLSLAESLTGPRDIPSLGKVVESIVGKGYTTSCVDTPLGNVVDHLIIVDQLGQPMEAFPDIISEAFNDLNGINRLRKIALVEVPNWWLCKPGLQLRGAFKTEFRLLQKEGLEAMPLFQAEIETLKAQEDVLVYVRTKLAELGVRVRGSPF